MNSDEEYTLYRQGGNIVIGETKVGSGQNDTVFPSELKGILS